MNQYDSNKIISYLNSSGNYKIVNFISKDIDLIILNTCSIRQKAQNKLFCYLDRIKLIKKNNPNMIVIVCGCVATQERKKIFLRNNIVDIIFGPQNLNKILYLINKFKKKRKKVIDINLSSIKKKFSNSNYYLGSRRTSSFVSIMEGCNKHCSYCIVPYTRGREISRSPMEIISEICFLSSKGICEVNLLGQNVNAYSSFLSNGKKCNFSYLLNLISEIDGIKRIRFTTSHPNNFSKDLILSYKNIPKIVNFLHLPVQSGSNKILKLMRRGYTIEYYKKLIDSILSVRPNMIFSSDFIVGFPGENLDDIKLTLNLISEIKFDNSYIFIYSPRPGTRSFYTNDNINIEEKKNRLLMLQNLIYKNSIYWINSMLYTKQNILVENYSKNNLEFLYGRTENNKIVYFKGNKELIGKLVNVNITNIKKNSLYGNLLNF